MRRRVVSAGWVAAWVTACATVWAASGTARLRGQILVSDEPLPELTDEAKMADVLKSWQKPVLEKGKEASGWSFHMVSFPTHKPGVSQVSLLFYDVSGAKRAYLTRRDITCDPAATILASDVDVSTEDGIKPGMKIELALAKFTGGRETDLAKGRLTFK